MQFLVGVFVFREPFTAAQFVGFLLVWAAVVLFTAEGLWTRRAVPVLDEAAG
jgi:chloramphenicol-sensitive protein RarD